MIEATFANRQALYSYMTPFDENFASQCISGDKKAQKQLFERMYPPMFRICLRYVAQHADAEDCLMLGFMKVFQNISKFNFTSMWFSWVTKNRFMGWPWRYLFKESQNPTRVKQVKGHRSKVRCALLTFDPWPLTYFDQRSLSAIKNNIHCMLKSIIHQCKYWRWKRIARRCFRS